MAWALVLGIQKSTSKEFVFIWTGMGVVAGGDWARVLFDADVGDYNEI